MNTTHIQTTFKTLGAIGIFLVGAQAPLWAETAKAETNVLAVSTPASPIILTPKPGPAPHINGPKVYGVRPGSPFLYRIPCTGTRPMRFGADHLPKGLTLDSLSGIITGTIAKPGTYHTTLSAQNVVGRATREFRIEVGDTLALTPPMGWNDWYARQNHITEAMMRKAADEMIGSGMADFGYQYVNVDDCWTKKQGDAPYYDSDGAVLPNANFPDMKGLADYIHSKGLKAGLYSSPGPWTCGGYTGSYGHEAANARKFSEWGFDFLKYDWCSFGQPDETRRWPNAEQRRSYGLDYLKLPFREMSELLKQQRRDIVFNLCQYGMGDVWKWGGEFGNSWRTTGDLKAERGGGKRSAFYLIGMRNAAHWQYARPGGWNDPDYITIGWVGQWGNSPEASKDSKVALTPDEQYSYMSMWSLMAAPLIFSGDMTKLDAFTLNVLCNAEVIDVDQDPLGKQAEILRHTSDEFVLVKPMEEGSKAVGLFNLTSLPRTVSVTFRDLDVASKQWVRDLWRQKELGEIDKAVEMEVPPHGVMLLGLRPDK